MNAGRSGVTAAGVARIPRWLRVMAGALLIVVALTSCNPAARDAARKGAGAGGDVFRVNLGYSTYVPYTAPMLVAQKLGYFRDEGLTVDLHNGTASAEAVQGVGAGNDDLAWVDLATAASAIGQGTPVKAVASTQPKGELGLTSLRSAGIERPKDIIGKRIGSNPSGSDPVALKLFLAANGISKDQVKIQNMSGTARLSAMLTDKLDLISGQGFHYQTLLTEKGRKSNFLLYGDHGANLLGHGFVANEAKVDEQGSEIRRFLKAYNRGLQYTKQHMDEACQVFLDTGVIGFTMAMCKQELNGWLPLLTTPQTEGKPIGWSSKTLWRETVDRLQKYGDIPSKPLTTYYTNAYVPSAS